MKNGQHLDNVLETLDLQQHSLGVLAVLCVKFSLPAPSATPDHHELLFAQVQEFITGCNGEQVRFAPDTCKPYLRRIFVLLMYVIYMET
jgi:COP9 signalosome complex subunit 3